MIVLVTGAAGFLGRRVARRLLADGHQVRGMVRPGRGGDLEGVLAVAGDLRRDEDISRAMEGVDAVVHCGAVVRTSGAWQEFQATNVDATARIVEIAGARPVVHVSSLSVYDVRRDGETITEDSPYESGAEERGFYSRSKLAADQLAMAAAAGGAPVTVVRPGVLYGPGRKPPLARQSFAVGRRRLILGRPDYLLPLVHGDNVADAIAAALERPIARGRAYTLVDPQVPLSEYLVDYRAAARASWRPLFVPASVVLPLVEAAGLLFRAIGRRAPVNAHQIQRATWSATYDCSRARQELGWTSRIRLLEGLRQSLGVAPTVAAEGALLSNPVSP